MSKFTKFFRPTIIKYGSQENIPQMDSGVVKFVLGSYRITVPTLALDSAVPGISVGTALGDVNIYTAAITLALDTAVPGISVVATSP